MPDASRAPVAVFCYDRPRHLELTLQSLGRCEGYDEHPLHIFCDAPRSDQAEPAVEKTRRVARDWIASHGGTLRLRESNLYFRNITDGISEMCAEQGRVIVLEDDLIVSPDFLRYMDAGLRRYAAEPRVYLISAFMYFDAQPPRPQTMFLPFGFPWGWGTWDRAWARFSYLPEGSRELLADAARRHRYDVNGGLKNSKDLEDILAGRLQAWDIQWTATIQIEDALGLYPWRSLTWNTGVQSGEHGLHQGPSLHGRSKRIHGDMSVRDFRRPRLTFPLEFPPTIEADERALDSLSARLRAKKPRTPWPSRLRRSLHRMLGR